MPTSRETCKSVVAPLGRYHDANTNTVAPKSSSGSMNCDSSPRSGNSPNDGDWF
ncbi:hypothetical protein [Nostoc sp. 106C]|uniref:hypothetical protein n=1 Tax=Nostoc sp. 106C TaxID=1932667 RepID=UPI001412E326|nr:hypothetical protein [Nostoc sp. 106C]